MRAADLLPLRDVRDKDARTHHILQLGSRLGEGGLDVADGLDRLGIGIAEANDLAFGAGSGGAGNADVIADAHCP